MPIPTHLIHYQCCECEKVYPDQEDAIECEKSHFVLDDFIVSFVSKEKSSNIDFPGYVHIANQKNDGIGLYVFSKTIKSPKINKPLEGYLDGKTNRY